MKDELKAPFPIHGSKSRVADLVWERLGNCDNYIEPFAGSAAVLLRRPADHFSGRYRVETINDAYSFIANFWRAVTTDPEKVAEYADNPVFEVDLHARHQWLMRSEHAAEWRERMRTDPDHYDAKIAGWWCWGMCCWIGSGWCTDERVDSEKVPYLASGGQLVTKKDTRSLDARGSKESQLMASMGTCSVRRAWLIDWMRCLSDRLRLVRTCYGHWSRVCDSESTLTRLGTTGVLLDAPYPTKTEKGTRAKGLYANDDQDLNALRDEVLAWCKKWGGNPDIRIAVCGYEGDGYESLGWEEMAWETSGGYGNQKKGKGKADNAKRERIWFSPACIPLKPKKRVDDVLREHPDWSDKRIADEVRVCHTTVGRHRQAMEARMEITRSSMRVGRDGKRHPSSRRSSGL